jgi:hypothetical protein
VYLPKYHKHKLCELTRMGGSALAGGRSKLIGACYVLILQYCFTFSVDCLPSDRKVLLGSDLLDPVTILVERIFEIRKLLETCFRCRTICVRLERPEHQPDLGPCVSITLIGLTGSRYTCLSVGCNNGLRDVLNPVKT